MLMKWKKYGIMSALLIVAVALISLYSYCSGIKKGVATNQTVVLSKESQDVKVEVERGDTDAVRKHLLKLCGCGR